MQRQMTKWQCYTKGKRSSRRQIRINQLDYLKCIFILLMIIFHLVYIGDKSLSETGGLYISYACFLHYIRLSVEC